MNLVIIFFSRLHDWDGLKNVCIASHFQSLFYFFSMNSFFFFEHAGELRINILRRKKKKKKEIFDEQYWFY